jgi:penicillin-binding protein-related factor A (putative recombinase)
VNWTNLAIGSVALLFPANSSAQFSPDQVCDTGAFLEKQNVDVRRVEAEETELNRAIIGLLSQKNDLLYYKGNLIAFGKKAAKEKDPLNRRLKGGQIETLIQNVDSKIFNVRMSQFLLDLEKKSVNRNVDMFNLKCRVTNAPNN